MCASPSSKQPTLAHAPLSSHPWDGAHSPARLRLAAQTNDQLEFFLAPLYSSLCRVLPLGRALTGAGPTHNIAKKSNTPCAISQSPVRRQSLLNRSAPTAKYCRYPGAAWSTPRYRWPRLVHLERRHLDTAVLQRFPHAAGNLDRAGRVAVNAHGIRAHFDHLSGD
jgi:hypothetical protein